MRISSDERMIVEESLPSFITKEVVFLNIPASKELKKEDNNEESV